MYTYAIDIEGVNYVANLIVSDGKVIWEKDENGVVFRKRLDGKFSLNRSGNEPLFDRILAITFCEQGILSVNNNTGLIIQGSFRKRHLTISEDKCRIDIKFDKIDEYTCIDKIADKEFNILANYEGKPVMPIYTAKHTYKESVEYISITGYVEEAAIYYFNGAWRAASTTGTNNLLYPYPYYVFSPNDYLAIFSWTFFSNKYELVSPGTQPYTNNFNITTTWAREVRSIIRLGEVQTTAPSYSGSDCDKYEWLFDSSSNIGGVVYDKFVRMLENTGIDSTYINSDYPIFTTYNTIVCTGTEYKFTRCRKLNDIINTMIYDCFPSGFKSEFFKLSVNPISGKDLSNIMLSQKSDCIFELDELNYVEKGDPATKGNITFNNLMDYLYNEFQVYWAIDENGDFRIEHKKYWDNNGSYTVENTVDIDLSLVYATALIGGNEYTFEEKIPIREKFSFMEAWNVDFVGIPIDYEECVNVGEELNYTVSLITTDIEPSFLFVDASKDGFCMFHCNSEYDDDGTFRIVREVGILSKFELGNAHLSWANLHDAYWKYGRYLPQGQMNDKLTVFDVRALKYQIPLSFPYCISEFNPQKLIKTDLGNGIVKSASFSFRTNFITVELEYIDSI